MKAILATAFCLFFINPISAQTYDVFEASRKGDVTSVQRFISEGISIDTANSKGFPLIVLAAYNRHTDLVKWLLEHGASAGKKDWMGNSPLMGVSFKGYDEIAELLLKYGADVNERNGIGATALMFAALSGRKSTVQLLLKNGADIAAIDQRGFTALALALHQGAEEVAKLLSGN